MQDSLSEIHMYMAETAWQMELTVQDLLSRFMHTLDTACLVPAMLRQALEQKFPGQNIKQEI